MLSPSPSPSPSKSQSSHPLAPFTQPQTNGDCDDSDSDDALSAEIFTPRTETQNAAIDKFWSDFEGNDASSFSSSASIRNRRQHTLLTDSSTISETPDSNPDSSLTSPSDNKEDKEDDNEEDNEEEIITSKAARSVLSSHFGLHYDYIEASLGLISWLLLLAFLYQYSAYAGYKYHYLIHEMSGYLILTFTVPFVVVMGLWYLDIKREEKINIDEIREKNKIINDIKKATAKGRKDK
ncbi:hypothetical protein TL16_g11252 [Triparma laevis f. inornata]|uniref:Uncharacterized protein n=1 Tax=Triparma laevis f. inornata TaxID=1714386 RepID=A0A9W7BIY2_9STRA|nr:hypothetical protein TL16_g11252 [Triparma laevis f. inornata]